MNYQQCRRIPVVPYLGQYMILVHFSCRGNCVLVSYCGFLFLLPVTLIHISLVSK